MTPRIRLTIYGSIVALLVSITFLVHAAGVPKDLQQKLETNNKELEKINQQIETTKQNLSATTAQSKTLKEELGRIQGNLNQLNLRTRATELTITQLGLEIERLQYTIEEAGDRIVTQREVLAELFQSMQRRDQEPELALILRTPTIADAVLEVEGMSLISGSLASTTRELIELHNALSDSLEVKTQKKLTQETQRKELKNLQAITLGEQQGRSQLLAQTKNQETIYTQTLAALQERQLAIASEIEKLEEELRRTIDPTLLPSARPGVFDKPVNGILTQGYGATKFAKYGYRGQWHNGVDWGAPIGTPVRAAETGTVVSIGDQDQYCPRGAYGKYIVVKHSNNLTTLYAHLSRIVVSPGDLVRRGDTIGYVGRTGYATGPHLHFTVYDSKTFSMRPSRSCGPMPSGGDINPLNYLSI